MKTRKAMQESEEPEQPVELSHLTVWDVARRAGVSIATVSRVVNQQGNVSDKTREKVMKSIHELEVENSRRSLARIGGSVLEADHPDLIALTSASLRGDEFPEIISGITEAIHARNARLVVCPIPRRHNCGMPLHERLMSGTARGGLIVGATDSDEELAETTQNDFPCVVIYPFYPVSEHIPVVTTAHWYNARIATEHLLALGHTRIATIISEVVPMVSNDRLAGYQSALLAAGLSPRAELIIRTYGYNMSDGYTATLQLLDLAEPPTAIVSFNDTMAAGSLQAASERGLVVPRDLSVGGCGDGVFARLSTPGLTTVSLPLSEMGRVGVDMLFRLMAGQVLDAFHIELRGRLVVRGSTCKIVT